MLCLLLVENLLTVRLGCTELLYVQARNLNRQVRRERRLGRLFRRNLRLQIRLVYHQGWGSSSRGEFFLKHRGNDTFQTNRHPERGPADAIVFRTKQQQNRAKYKNIK